MLRIQGESPGAKTGLSRRGFLQIGSLGLAGLSLETLLQTRKIQAAAKRKDTSIILFWMAGGPSHLDTYDMKPDAPAEVRGPFQAVPTRLRGFRINELLPRHAQLADRLAIIRSLHHEHGVHDDASHWVQTGYPLLNARLRGQQNPSQGAVLAHLRPPTPGLPNYVCIPEAYSSRLGFYQRAAFLGSRFDPINAGGDPGLGKYRLPEFALPADLTLPRLESRRELLRLTDRLARRAEEKFQGLNNVQAEAFDLVSGPRARTAFDLSREPAPLREKYGKHAYGQSALLARRLIEAGVGFVTINLYEADVDWWDDHTGIEKNLQKRLPMFDQALGTLLEDLGHRGLSDRVLVVACGEFGRAPTIDSQAGRGHWPKAFSALLAGGGIRGGQLIGATTANGAEPRDRPLRPGDLLASMYRVLGIDHESTVVDRQARPVRLVDEGQPISELF